MLMLLYHWVIVATTIRWLIYQSNINWLVLSSSPFNVVKVFLPFVKEECCLFCFCSLMQPKLLHARCMIYNWWWIVSTKIKTRIKIDGISFSFDTLYRNNINLLLVYQTHPVKCCEHKKSHLRLDISVPKLPHFARQESIMCPQNRFVEGRYAIPYLSSELPIARGR